MKMTLDRDAWAARQAALDARHAALDTPAKRAEAAAIIAKCDAAIDAVWGGRLPHDEYVRIYNAAHAAREAELDALAARTP